MNCNTKLMRFLTTPQKIAAALDWKEKVGGSILSIDIGREQMGMAAAFHPSTGEESVETLSPLKLKFDTTDDGKGQNFLALNTMNELQYIVREYNVCGFVVSWPLQKEGRHGAQCGRVLYTLDSLIASDSSLSILTPGRQFCLWVDHKHIASSIKDDRWGRSPLYAQPTTKTLHVASLEQYNNPQREQCNSKAAVGVWNNFCRIHWPKLYQEHYYHHRQECLSCHSDEEQHGYDNTKNSCESENFCGMQWLRDYEADFEVPAL